MSSKSKDPNKDLFFVEIKDPVRVRREILETLKGIIELLQKFEHFRQIRHQKIEHISNLRSLVRETHRLMGQIKARMPQTDLKATVHVPAKDIKESVKEEIIPKKEYSELDKLAAELESIESQLKDLK